MVGDVEIYSFRGPLHMAIANWLDSLIWESRDV
jgi:hypothetical protein